MDDEIELLTDTDRRSVTTADPRADSLAGRPQLAHDVLNQSRTDKRSFVPPVLAVRSANSSTRWQVPGATSGAATFPTNAQDPRG